MARTPSAESFTLICPCCQATLTIDPELKIVLHHQVPAKAPVIDDLAAAAKRLDGEAARREAAFNKSFEELKAKESVMDRKFEELLKQAKNTPGTTPPKKIWD